MKFSGIEYVGFLFLLSSPTANAQNLREVVHGAEDWQQHRRHLSSAVDTYIFQNIGDGYATGQGDKVGTPCYTDSRYVSFVESSGDDVDYMDITTTKWHSGGYRMDCQDKGSHTGWSCWATCSPFPNPNFMDWSYLTFEVKLVNAASLADGCGPTLTVTKRWPMHSSNTISLSGNYVDGGQLVDSEFRRVVIPVADFATEQWPNVDGVKDIYFKSCGTNGANPHYQVRGLLLLTSDPPNIGSGPDPPAPMNVSAEAPTPATPTPVPTKSPTPAPAFDGTYIFQNIGDGYATGQGDKVGTPCYTDSRYVSFVAGSCDGDYIDIATTKWHSGGYRMDCQDKGSHTGWSCWATCSPFPNPNFMDWSYLTFEVKLVNAASLADGCGPTLTVTKRWPMHSSNTISLSGNYVDGGQLVDSEFRRVVIPVADFATEQWPNVDGVKDIYFKSCGMNGANPHYQVRGLLLLTSDPPNIGSGQDPPAPMNTPNEAPTTAAPVPTPIPTPIPTLKPTLTPTPVPTKSPTVVPTIPLWPIFYSTNDAFAVGAPSISCFIQKDRLGITTTADPVDGDFFTITPDGWVSGGLRFGCMQKDDSHSCISSCNSVDGSNPDWSQKLYLTFKAKIEGAINDSCKPRITLTGGGWPRLSSHTVALEDTYVDAGWLVSDEWRRVFIPLDDFKTELWSLTSMYGMHFLTCGTDHLGDQPTYHVSELAVTNIEFELVSQPPSLSPTDYVTDDPLLATHRWVHKNWYPIFGEDREPEGNKWIVAQNNAWPVVSGSPAPRSLTVLIPRDQTVIYSGAELIPYDKIIVEGTLTIQPYDADVMLTVGTIVVEKGGILDIQTKDSSHSIEIDIEGELDQTLDPEEQLLGIVSLEGHLTITGDPISTKMVPLSEAAIAGSTSLRLHGTELSNVFQIGGELILPDTQTGLNVGHWNFPNLGVYVDQTESCIIASIEAHNVFGSAITCQSPLSYSHASGSYVGYITRSITIRTSPNSHDNGHILHTGTGKFDVRNTRIEHLGRTTTDEIDSTVMAPAEGVNFPRDSDHAQMIVSHLGTNQIARYALHAHHSLVESYFAGNALLYSPRDGCVAHNSRVHIVDNIVVGADGTGVFLEDATETGPVINNYIIGTGGGSRGGDDGRFSTSKGSDMAHGGFGIWARGKLALIKDNHCEGHFGVAPYAFFVHPNFLDKKRVPDAPGTPPALAGKLLRDIPVPDETNGLQLQTYGGFIDNSAVGTFQVGIDLSYFSAGSTGSIIEGANIVSLASAGRGISTTHSKIFTLNHVTIEGTVEGNSITGIWCNNCNGCTLETPNTTLVVEHVNVVRGGNC